MSTSNLVVTDNAESNRYEIHADGVLAAWVDYSLSKDLIIFMHTETVPAFAGQGIASELVKALLEDVKSRGLAIVPICPFVQKWIARNPEVAETLPIQRSE